MDSMKTSGALIYLQFPLNGSTLCAQLTPTHLRPKAKRILIISWRNKLLHSIAYILSSVNHIVRQKFATTYCSNYFTIILRVNNWNSINIDICVETFSIRFSICLNIDPFGEKNVISWNSLLINDLISR